MVTTTHQHIAQANLDQAPVPLNVIGPEGLQFDFNEGVRLWLPPGKWHIRLLNLDTNTLITEEDNEGGTYALSEKKYYIRWRIEVRHEKDGPLVLEHDYDARDRNVMIYFPVGTIGDSIAWFSFVGAFINKHHCRATVMMSPFVSCLFEKTYPHITFVGQEDFQGNKQDFYASYKLGIFWNDVESNNQPCDFRLVGLHKTAAYILGVEPKDTPPLATFEGPSDLPFNGQPYVCISVQATTQCKYWNNPRGWDEVVAFLKAKGYKVVCIDRGQAYGQGYVLNKMPEGVEDETGQRPLTERAWWLKHCAFYIGLSSGISWLAWACRVPTIMISGFTHPQNEFYTPWRIINYGVCNSCWNDTRYDFVHDDFMWCPRHKGDIKRHFECSVSISSKMVMDAINNLEQVEGLVDAPEA